MIVRADRYIMCDTLGPKALKETPTRMTSMNRKTIEDNDINHDDCFTNHERCLI